MKIILNDIESEEIEIIVNGKLSDERVLNIVEALRSVDSQERLILKSEDKSVIKELEDIEYFESNGNNVIAIVENKKYSVCFKLYETEVFSTKGFVRISKSCVVNIAYISHIEPEFSGNYLLVMKNGNKLIVSRSYFKSFKKFVEGGDRNEEVY